MKWKGRRQSSNVTDARGRRVSGGGSAAGAMMLQMVVRTFGAKGIAVLALLGAIYVSSQ